MLVDLCRLCLCKTEIVGNEIEKMGELHNQIKNIFRFTVISRVLDAAVARECPSK